MRTGKKTASGQQIRRVDTPAGEMFYVLIRKRVKNLNLRIRPDGQVVLSVPWRCSSDEADSLVRRKWEWIAAAQARRQAVLPELLPLPDRETCLRLLMEALTRVWPLAAPLGVALPDLKVRKMRSQWGNCHWAQGYITLNLALARCPEHLRDYVALHELIHFIHHDHGPGFYEKMDVLMPDWRQRRGQLKAFAPILIEKTE